MSVSDADMLATVERSPQAAAAHNRAAWVDLFTADGRIEDPVGSRPHTGRMEIARFYDTFIGPRQISFRRGVDIVAGRTVIRDLLLDVTMTPAPTLHIPAYLRYDLREEDGVLKIAALRAYWELPAMMRRFLRGGARSLPAGVQLSRALLANQGTAGVMGYLLAFRGIGGRTRTEFDRFLADAAIGDEVAVRRRLTKGVRITVGDHQPLTTANLLARLARARTRKLISAGHSLVVGIEHAQRRDVLIAEVDPTPLTINRLRYFTDAG